MIGRERLVTAQVHFVVLAVTALRQCRLVQADIIRHLEPHTQLWNVLIRHIPIITLLVTVKLSAPANQGDYTSNLLHRMVKKNDLSHQNECFQSHHCQHLTATIIYTQMVETLHRLHHLPIKSITEAVEAIARW